MRKYLAGIRNYEKLERMRRFARPFGRPPLCVKATMSHASSKTLSQGEMKMTRLCSDRRQRPTLGDLVVAVTDFAMEISDDEEQAYRMTSKAINEYLRRSRAES